MKMLVAKTLDIVAWIALSRELQVERGQARMHLDNICCELIHFAGTAAC